LSAELNNLHRRKTMATCQHKRYSVSLGDQTGTCCECRKEGREMFVTDQEAARAKAIEAAATTVVRAFEALGNAQHAGAVLMQRTNCELAMVSLKGALFNTGDQR